MSRANKGLASSALSRHMAYQPRALAELTQRGPFVDTGRPDVIRRKLLSNWVTVDCGKSVPTLLKRRKYSFQIARAIQFQCDFPCLDEHDPAAACCRDDGRKYLGRGRTAAGPGYVVAHSLPTHLKNANKNLSFRPIIKLWLGTLHLFRLIEKVSCILRYSRRVCFQPSFFLVYLNLF